MQKPVENLPATRRILLCQKCILLFALLLMQSKKPGAHLTKPAAATHSTSKRLEGKVMLKISHTGDVHLGEDRYFDDTAQCLEWFVAGGREQITLGSELTLRGL